LRARVAALCALLGLVVSSCLAMVAVHFSDSYVHRLINEMLRVEGDWLRERFAADGTVPHPRSKHFYAYASGGGGADPPAELTGLGVGEHEIEESERGERHVAVYEVGGRRLYVVLDIGLESVRERRLARDLVALVLFGSALSCWLGWFWAGRAIEPVRRLAEQVETMALPTREVPTLAPDFAADEVGALAQAFDRYQERLLDYVRRERAFTADASHELRTPLAVIRGAIEVLLDHGAVDAPTATRLKRIQRGADELRDLLDALLVLARGDERAGDGRTADLGELVDGLLRERQDAFAERRLRIEREIVEGVVVAAPAKVLGVVLGNLLRAVTQFADGGVLRVRIAPGTATIAHEDGQVTQAQRDPARRSLDMREQVLGLAMIRRVCERWGWRLDENIDGAGVHAFVLRFAAA
jgi:signal transduction histidine kinase